MKLLNDHFEYTIGTHWFSAIINDDYTGLSNEEENQLNRFLSESNNLDDARWQMPENESHFAICEISGLFSDCYTVKLHFTNPSLKEITA